MIRLKDILEKLNNAYHAVRAHRSYGINDSPHLERCEKNMKDAIDLLEFNLPSLLKSTEDK